MKRVLIVAVLTIVCASANAQGLLGGKSTFAFKSISEAVEAYPGTPGNFRGPAQL